MSEKKLIIERVEQTIAERGLCEAASPVLLMVSGGSDSTALAYIACELAHRGVCGPVGIMHVNHQLRGENSDGDAKFVTALAELLDVPLYLYNIDVRALVDESGENLEALARGERYSAARDALEKLCRYAGCPVSQGRIFTAHTRNDRAENFYMRSIVGTGPGGFRSMLYCNGPVCRPLLDTEREELRDYLCRRKLDAKADESVLMLQDEVGALWREDATNAHTDQFRGYVRHTIIPAALERNARLLEVLCRSMNLIADEDDMLNDWTEELLEKQVQWLGSCGEELDSALAAAKGACRGCLLKPGFAKSPVPLQRRAAVAVLQRLLGYEARIESRSVSAILDAFAEGAPQGGYTNNIQGDLALSANKQGLRIEQMQAYRARRKKL